MRPLDNSLPLKLLKAREAVMDRFRPHLNASGVTEQQWRVLRALSEHNELDAGALAQLICIRMPSLSRILRDLEAMGYLVKERSADDGRLVNTRITPGGRRFFHQASTHSEDLYDNIETTLGSETYDRLMHDLDTLIDTLKDRPVAKGSPSADKRKLVRPA